MRQTHARRPKPSGTGRGIHVRPCDSTPNSNPSPPLDALSPSTFYMPDTSAPDDPQQTRDARPRRTTETRDIPLSSAAQLRAPLRLPHLTFSSSDEKLRKPPARAASRSAEDRVPISAPLAPTIASEVQPPPRSSLERPRTREREPRSTSNVRPCTVSVSRNPCHITATSASFLQDGSQYLNIRCSK